jgi:hypothetical protein
MSSKSYTWQEVAKHNTRQSAWVSVEGKVYDVTKWVDSHPGGSEYIELAAGNPRFDSHFLLAWAFLVVLVLCRIGDLPPTISSHSSLDVKLSRSVP